MASDQFREQLSRRLNDLIDRREQLAAAIEQAQSDLQLTSERIEAAGRLYEVEYGERPAQLARIGAERLPTEAPRKRGRVRVGMNWAHEVAHVLAEAGEPLHVEEIWARLEKAGFRTSSSDPLRAIVATTSRRSDLLVRTAPNTYALANLDDASAVSIPTELLTAEVHSMSAKKVEVMEEAELEGAERTIRDHDLPPLVAMADPTVSGHYRVIDGHRRLGAARRAGVEQLPTIVINTASTTTRRREPSPDVDLPERSY